MEKNPLTIIIFGATGDLAKKKLVPALFHLFRTNLLPENFKITGFSRKDLSHEEYRLFCENVLREKITGQHSNKIEHFLEKVFYVSGDINVEQDYQKLNESLIKSDEDFHSCSDKLFYLAVPPNLYESVFLNLSKSGLMKKHVKGNTSWDRVLVEKPFGDNQEKAKKLDLLLGELFHESQIFRIDHYLAKEALQNILAFRFANAIFEPVWNKEHIQKVEIKLHEAFDIEGRSNFYDDIGALKDVGQNHILQMIALIAMEDPMSLETEKVRQAREKVLSKIEPNSKSVHDYALRAQYIGYQDENGNDKVSNTETFFRIILNIKNKRWDKVPFVIESGKALKESRTEIRIIFKDRESSVCRDSLNCHYNNEIVFEIQPKQKISLKFWFKENDLNLDIKQEELFFEYKGGDSKIRDAYEKVLFDCISGDQTLFPSTQEVSIQWGLIAKIINEWQVLPLIKYEKGELPDLIK